MRKTDVLAHIKRAAAGCAAGDGRRCELEYPVAEDEQSPGRLGDEQILQWDQLSFLIRRGCGLAHNPRQRRTSRRGDKEKIEAHLLAERAELIFHRAACIVAGRTREEQLHAGFEFRTFSLEGEKTAVLKIGLGLGMRQGELARPKGREQAAAHRGLHQFLRHPEAGGEQQRKGTKHNKNARVRKRILTCSR